MWLKLTAGVAEQYVAVTYAKDQITRYGRHILVYYSGVSGLVYHVFYSVRSMLKELGE